jgi:hypothetical protein
VRRRATRTILVISMLSTVLPSAAARAQDKASEVLAQARDAIGVKPSLTVTSLGVKATVRRMNPAMGMEVASDVQLECLLPGRYRRTETINVGAMTIEVTVGMNGDEFFYDDGGRSAALGLDPTPAGPRRVEAIKNLRLDLARMLTVWLLSPLDGQAYAFAYAGVAEAPDGKADTIDVTGPDDFNLRLFFDTQTHRLLMATYKMETVDLDKEKMQAIQADVMKKMQETPEKRADIMREMQDQVAKLPKKTATVEMHVSDYRTVDGLSIPHQMTVSGQAQGQEEWAIGSFKLNPTLKPERFAKKK